MELGGVLGAELAAVDVSTADRAGVETVLAAVARVRGWLDGVEVACARRLAVLAEQGGVLEPDQVVGAATRTGPRHGRRVQARVVTVATVPAFGRALAEGAVSGSHVDVLGDAVRSLSPAQRGVLVDRSAELVDLAAQTTPTGFRRHVERLTDAIRADGGVGRLARQQAQVRLRTWVEPDTGMIRLSGRFDPDTGTELVRRLRDQADSLFHATVPAHCPDDPVDKQDFLRAHALLSLVNGGGSGRPVVIMTIDHRTATDGWHAGSRVDVGLDGVRLPVGCLQERIHRAELVPVVVDAHGVAVQFAAARPGGRTDLATLPARVAAEPGLPLDVGRTRRLARGAKRLAMQAM